MANSTDPQPSVNSPINSQPGKLTITPTHHGEPISKGDTIADFRGDTWLFDSIARMPDPDGRSGKVMVLPIPENEHIEPNPSTLRVFNFEVFPDFGFLVGNGNGSDPTPGDPQPFPTAMDILKPGKGE